MIYEREKNQLRKIAIFSSTISVAYTVILAVDSSRALALGGSSFYSFVVFLLSVSFALCLETSKYSFLRIGSRVVHSEKKSVEGASFLLLSILISLISVAATCSYMLSIEKKTDEESLRNELAEIEEKIKNSDTIRVYTEALKDLGDKMEIQKKRIMLLSKEKNNLLDSGYVTRSKQVSIQEQKASDDIDSILLQKQDISKDIEEEKGKILALVKSSREGITKTSEKESLGKLVVIVLSVMLEVISMLSVSSLALAGAQEAKNHEQQEASLKKPSTPEESKTPKEKKKEKGKQAPVSNTPVVSVESIHESYCSDLEGILQKLRESKSKETVSGIRNELKCSQSTALRIAKEIREYRSEKLN